MRIQTVSDLSGLSRSQINLLISNFGISVRLGDDPAEGLARDFSPADAFAFCIAGRAAALGCDRATLRDLIVSLPMPTRDPQTFRPLEIFPGYSRSGNPLWLVARHVDGAFCTVFVPGDRLWAALKPATASLVMNASEIAAEIEAADGR